MAARSWLRGHEIFFDENIQKYRYSDNKQIADDNRQCPRCGKYPTLEGHDACLGTIKGVTHACCGHGVTESYQTTN